MNSLTGHGSRSRFHPGLSPAPLLLLVMLTLSRQAAGAMSATTRLNAIGALESPVFVDARSADTCARGSVEGAFCMEPSLFLHPDGTPASFRDINWLAGTFGLEPASTAVVFGGDETDNAFVAGMLFLLGQSRVVVWRGEGRALLDSRKQGAGRLRGVLRGRFHTAPVRDDHIALDNDARAFFGAGAVTRLDYPRSFDEAGWLRGPPKDAPLLYRDDDDGSLLLLARDTREAVAHLTRLLIRDPAAPARVHLDGLRGRAAESFGAPRADLRDLLLPAVALGILAILCIAVAALAVRGRRT